MKKKTVLIVSACVLVCAAVVVSLFATGVLLLNNPSSARYPVRGVDVSSYQGNVDWDAIKAQGISFVFIKATEGSSYTDSQFRTNHDGAISAGLRVGAYHFFSYDSPGASQADHFIAEVPVTESMLPPVIDLEFYGDYTKDPPQKTDVMTQLEAYIEKIRKAYDMDPIIYATMKSYNLYVKGEFLNCDVWIADTYSTPILDDGREWSFWQYASRGRLDGYDGEERYIDLNVFNGTVDKFNGYPLNHG